MIKYRKKIKRGLLFLVMVFLSFVVNIPNISMIGTALKPFGGYMSDKSLFPSNPDFSMLRKVLFGTTFGRYLANSVFIALVVVVFCVVFASCAGYALSRCRGKVFTGYTVFLLMLQMFPLVLVLIPLFWIFKTLGLVDNQLSVIICYISINLPFATWMLKGFFDDISIDIEEAAFIDGCTRWQTYWKIVFPLLKPTIATVAIIDAMAFWNDYLLPSLVLGRKELYTLPIATQAFYGTYSTDLGLVMAALLLAMLPILVLYLFLQRYIVEGVTSGAVKG